MKKRVLAMLMAAALVVGCFAGCGDDKGKTSSAGGTTSSAASTSKAGDDSQASTASTPSEPSNVSTGPADTTEHYDFTVYYNYEGWNKQFGQDEYSKFLADKFNISINWYGPDSDPNAKLNLMVSSNDLPESIILDRGPTLQKIVDAGMIQDLRQYMYEGNTFEQDIAESTRTLLTYNDCLYGVPNWARKGATGGNYQWIVNTSTYEAAGSPKLETLQDLHDYAAKVKELNLTTADGQSVLPFACTNTSDGLYVYQPFYRATGAPNLVLNYWTQEDGKIDYCLNSEKFIQAMKEANKWYKEGLFNAETFTDNADQWLAKLTSARPALMWYDFSLDNTNNFRRIVRKNSDNKVSYEVLGYKDMQPDSPMFPGFDGVDVTYGDEAGTIGWNVNCVTTKATDPQRIFDLWTYMITPEGSLYVQYGPEGGTLLESVDRSGDLPAPVLKKTTFSPEESDAAGAWFWTQPAQSDYVDGIKFAYNDTLPDEEKDWVVDIQSHLCTYDEENPRIGQKFSTDQLTNINENIDMQSDTGVNYQQILDQSKAELPKIIMAKDDAEFDSLVKGLLDFVNTYNVAEINSILQEKFDSNVAAQGFNAYSDDYDVYKLK